VALLVIPMLLSCQLGGRCARRENGTPTTDEAGSAAQEAEVAPAEDQGDGVPEDDPSNLIGRRPPYMAVSVVGVWGTSPDNVWAVTRGRRNGFAIRWNGSTWTHVPNTAGTMDAYYAIWGSGADDIWLVGSNWSTHGDPITHWDGRELAPAQSGIEPSLVSVWGSGANDVWAVGHGGAMAHWDGTSWRAVTSPVEGDLVAVWGHARDGFYAVGCEGSLDNSECRAGFVLRFDGSSWSVMRRGPEFKYDLVWGSGPRDVWVVGSHFVAGQGTLTRVLRWNGSEWSYLEFPGPPDSEAYFTGMGGSGSTDVWFGGMYYMPDRSEQNFVFRYDGESFHRVTSAEMYTPSAFWPNGPRDLWIGGHESVGRWNDGAWSSDLAPGLFRDGPRPMLHQDTPPEGGL